MQKKYDTKDNALGTASAIPCHSRIRSAELADLSQIIRIDKEVTGVEKAGYWQERLTRGPKHLFLVAAEDTQVLGYIVGEIRDWEFGTEPCGWVFGICVNPEARLSGVASQLLDALCSAFRNAGMTKIKTLLAHDDLLVMSFYRSQGMMAAPFIVLEGKLE